MFMSLNGVLTAAAVAFVSAVTHYTNFTFAVIALAVVGSASYLVSLRLHPNTNCGKCSGSAKHRGAVWVYAHRPCRKCGGTGRKMRWGYRTFTEQGRTAYRLAKAKGR